MLLSIQSVTKHFEGKLALDGVSLDVASGEIVCLLGPSGCGKTTLLRIIAGLETPDAGQLLFEGQNIGPIPRRRPSGQRVRHKSAARSAPSKGSGGHLSQLMGRYIWSPETTI